MDISILLNEEVLLSASILNSLVLVIILSIVFVIAGRAIKRSDPRKPTKGIALIFELFVGGIDGFCKNLTNDPVGRYSALIGMLVLYLIPANLLGLIGLTSPTSNYNVTLSLAVFSLFILHGSGIKLNGFGSYFKGLLLGDFPALLPLNFIGELAKFLSLSFRLFGNILSGGILSAVVIQLAGWLTIPFMPFLNIYFDIFAGLLQTLIFTFLLMIWLGDTIPANE